MRFPILLAVLAIAALPRVAAAEQPEVAAVCTDGKSPMQRFPNWATSSDAVCDYDFIEVNRRLAGLLELPSGGANVAWLKQALNIPRFVQREGYEPNGFFVVNAGYMVALSGPNGWEMVIETYERRREGDWGRKDNFDVTFHGTGLSPVMEADSRGRCLTEAALLDRAIAAGWRYVPGAIESGTAGPIFMPGALVTDDGRRLRLVHLSNTSELPPRETLEATCAWIFSFNELKETRAADMR